MYPVVLAHQQVLLVLVVHSVASNSVVQLG
jgi:hypothetical protein